MRFPEKQQAFSARNPSAGYESVIPNPKLRLMDQVREVMRLKHYSIRTERTYREWLRRFVHFHRMKCREELLPAEPKIEAFLSELAVKGNVAVSTQNQAFNALLFVYREVLHVQVGKIESVRATRPARRPCRMVGSERARLMMPPAATAPAPM
jgi:Phage integrase, N-terminal SAM-like domain